MVQALSLSSIGRIGADIAVENWLFELLLFEIRPFILPINLCAEFFPLNTHFEDGFFHSPP